MKVIKIFYELIKSLVRYNLNAPSTIKIFYLMPFEQNFPKSTGTKKGGPCGPPFSMK
jgi:hypothetical protein